MYSITILWPLLVFLVWFGCTGLALSTYLISLVAPDFLDNHPVGQLMGAGTHVFMVGSLTFLLFMGTMTLYALLVIEWLNRALLVEGHTARVAIRHVPALPIPASLEPIRLGIGQTNDYDGGQIPEEVSVDTSAPDGASDAVMRGELTMILDDHPDWIDHIEHMVVWEEAHPPTSAYDGWEWQDVRTPPAILNQMLVRGFLNRVYSSRKSTLYRLVSLDETREALDMLRDVSRPAERERVALEPDKMFSQIIGHDEAKFVLRSALEATKPVHVLLWGPPGTAKSFLLDEVGHLPGAELYTAVMATKSGLTNLLIQKRPRYLVLHEIDKMPNADMTPLLNLMEEGFVDALQYKKTVRVALDCKVFATANDITKLSPPIVSRFFPKEIPGYTRSEFLGITQTLLIRREGVGAEVARLIANEVARHCLDVRVAINVGKMCAGDPRRALALIQARFPEGARLTTLPRKE